MNRTLQILSAFLPLTDALAQSDVGDAAAAAFDGSTQNSPKRGESLSEAAVTEDDTSSDGDADGSGGPAAHSAPSLQGGTSGEAGEGARATPSGGGSYNPQIGGDHSPMMTHMQAPKAEGSGPLDPVPSGGAAGGGFIHVGPGKAASSTQVDTNSVVIADIESEMATQTVLESTSGGSPETLGPLEVDAVAEDTMMILLGGMSAAVGEGAQSSGEVELEIVDYGSLTIGFGQATYSASGSEDAVADTFVDVVGADLVYTFETNYTLAQNQAVSATYVLAIDFEYGRPAVVGSDGQGLSQYLASTGIGEGSSGLAFWSPEDHVGIDGNAALFTIAGITDGSSPLVIQADTNSVENTGSIVVANVDAGDASLSVNASALGSDTLVNVDGTINVDDHFSSVGGVVIGVA